MAFINTYKPLEPRARRAPISISQDPYDINWSFPLPPSLETQRVKLVPFVPLVHAQMFLNGIQGHTELLRYMPILITPENFLEVVEEKLRSDPNCVLFTIIDKTKPDANNPDFGGSVAGVIGLMQTSAVNLSTEIGCVIIIPHFQRTHLTSNAIGILMRYCFELPASGGLGFRRVQWTTSPQNKASRKVAERMGLVYEGTMRWMWTLPEGKEGQKSRDGDPCTCLGRDSELLAVCWDDWESGIREHVDCVVNKV